MRKLFSIVALLLLLSGCMNLYLRTPLSDETITNTYQPTYYATIVTYVTMFPQCISPAASDHDAWMVENFITVPIGCVVGLDIPFDFVIDTILYPVDYFMVKKKQ